MSYENAQLGVKMHAGGQRRGHENYNKKENQVFGVIGQNARALRQAGVEGKVTNAERQKDTA